eukprot:SM000032S12032  [mRNA]  locus=s32:82671:84951:- [translate_table: standard]
MLSRVAASLRQLAGRLSPRGELVGRDAAGNQYFRAPRALDGGAGEIRLLSLELSATTVATCSSGDGAEPSQRAAHEGERRWVQFKERIPDPRSLPVEWASWLANTRASAPTQQEIDMMVAQRRLIKYKATMLEKEEEKRRYRAKSIQESAGADDMSAESMGRLLEQITGVAPEGKSTGDDYMQVQRVEESHPTSASLWIGLSPPSNTLGSHLCMLHDQNLVGMGTNSSLEHGGLHDLRLLARGCKLSQLSQAGTWGFVAEKQGNMISRVSCSVIATKRQMLVYPQCLGELKLHW